MKGKIIETVGEPKAHRYTIEDADGNRYFAHFGDLDGNEKLVQNSPRRVDLKNGEEVEFEIAKGNLPHVYHVKKSN